MTTITPAQIERFPLNHLVTSFNDAIRSNRLDADTMEPGDFEDHEDAADQLDWLCKEYGLTLNTSGQYPSLERGDNDVPCSEGGMEETLIEMFCEQYDFSGPADVRRFAETGLLTRDKGVVVRFDNGIEFQITIVRSK